MTAFVANTNLLTLVGLTSHITDIAINDATVTVTVMDSSGVEVTGETWPLTMDYISGSDGNYQAVLTDTLPLIARRAYVAEINADAGTGRQGQWQFKFRPEIRR